MLEVLLENETAHAARVMFSVKDTGIGIPVDRQDRLFKSFSQVDTSTTRKYGGSGLGLAISKQLVHLMGGRIELESRENKGSTFHFTLEFEKQQPGAAKGVALFPADIKTKRFLIVDDHPINRKILKAYLDSWGCYNQAAASGPEALRMLYQAEAQATPFDIVLSDHMMPEMDGETLGTIIMQAIVLNPAKLAGHGFNGLKRGDKITFIQGQEAGIFQVQQGNKQRLFKIGGNGAVAPF